VRGAAAMRRLMQRMPDAVRGEIIVELNLAGRELAQEMQRRAPTKAGDLRAGLSYKVFAKTMKLQAGLLGTKRGRAKLFYGYIQDMGRKAQTVTVHRLNKGERQEWRARISAGRARGFSKPKDLGTTYQLRVKAMAPKRFVSGSFKDIRVRLNANLKNIWARALARVAGGSE
jgi:hypothetical protein